MPLAPQRPVQAVNPDVREVRHVVAGSIMSASPRVPGPLPTLERSAVVVEAPGRGPGYWAGAPSAVLAGGVIYLAYRFRRPVGDGRGYANVVARSEDGERFETVLELRKDDFDTDSLERPALVARPDGGWRVFVSCGTPGTLHWRIDAIDADDPARFDPRRRTAVLPGDQVTAYKDPVVRWDGTRWHLWVCRHDLAIPEESDRMYSEYGTSADGLVWQIHGVALAGRPGHWDQRGARITSVLLDGRVPMAYYDGRAAASQNWHEQMGVAVGDGQGRFEAVGDTPVGMSPHDGRGLRYADAVRLADGGSRLAARRPARRRRAPRSPPASRSIPDSCAHHPAHPDAAAGRRRRGRTSAP
jgi:hypothetical protein